jgi:succinate-semialdehyde dehydrogenase/glutarate-semialdehyde dehydrogenase
MTQNPSPLLLLKDPSLLKTDALINGQWVTGPSRFDVLDPATGHKLADVANLGPTQATQAIAAADAAWPAWRNKTGKERSIILRKWFDLLMANQEDLARIRQALCRSQGRNRLRRQLCRVVCRRSQAHQWRDPAAV